MANYDWDDMNNQGNAGKGLLTTLIIATGGMAIKITNDKKKKEKLKEELNEVRSDLSKKKGNIFKEAWNYNEIERLEERERELIQEINNL